MLTLFGNSTSSAVAAHVWDAKCGFATEGAAADARRREDILACRILGVRHEWYPFREAGYDHPESDQDIYDAVVHRLADAELLLIPGHPLTHPDHVRAHNIFCSMGIIHSRLGVYLEQPYAGLGRPKPSGMRRPDNPVSVSASTLPEWHRIRPTTQAFRRKRAAVSAYRSQLPHLGRFPRVRLGVADALARSEAIRWLTGGVLA